MSEESKNDATAGLLTKRDFMVACQALAETHNRYLEAYNDGDVVNEYSEEEMEYAIQNTHATFIKFQAILMATMPEEDDSAVNEEDDTQSTEEE